MKPKNLKWPSALALSTLAMGTFLQTCLGEINGGSSSKFNDFMDLGCHVTAGRPGSPAAAMSNAGGNQAECISCGGSAEGMPTWWVHEPYINLWIADEPLSYTTSSGQRIAFRWTYRERGLLQNTAWAAREYESLGVAPPELVKMRYSEHQAGGNVYMSNASWEHNWWSEILFWDPGVETQSSTPAVVDQFGSDPNDPTNTYVGFTTQYQGLLYRGDGGTIHFDVSNASTLTSSGQFRVEVLNQTNVNDGPRIPYVYTDFYSGLVVRPYSHSAAFFVTNAFCGFKVTFPDGSQDIYGLVLAHADVTSYKTAGYGPPPLAPRDSTASAYLTTRIDPQGRATQIGYQPNFSVHFNNLGVPDSTNFAGYNVKYVVDSDGRTNTYNYDTNNFKQLVSITDPYGRTAQFTPDSACGFSAITDAQTNTTTFSYQTSSSGWMDHMVTPYGTTTFVNYELQEAGATNQYQQRALYVSEPTGAQQLFCYLHQAPSGVPSSTNAPTVSGETFDSGSSGSSSYYALSYRDSFHWGRRQFASLSSSVKNNISTLSTALGNLSAADFQKAETKHWMLDPDFISITETLSSERDPSPDPAGLIPGAWTFYANGNASSGPEIDYGAQVSSVARRLPDGTSQYVRYHYSPYSPVVVSDSETSVTLTNGSLGELTNYFQYAATNTIDLLYVSNSIGQYSTFGNYTNHQPATNTDALNQGTSFSYSPATHNLTGVSLPGGETITLTYYGASNPTNPTSRMLQQMEVEPQGRFINFTAYVSGLPRIVHVSGTGLVDLWMTNYWDNLNRLTGTSFEDNTTISNIYTALDLTDHKDRLDHWTHYSYDALQHVHLVTDANTNVTQFDWCGCGSLSGITDALTNITSLYYDNQGRLTNVAFPDFASLTYQYDLNGRMTNALDGSGRFVQYAYNNQDLVTDVSNTNGTLLHLVYDLVSRPQSATDANGISVTNTYDPLNRVLKRTRPDQQSELFSYTANGLVAYTNRDQKVTLFERDNAGRLITVTNANQELTRFTYDAADRIKTLTDGLSHVTTWNYNQFGWLTNKLDATNHVVLTNGYDANGQLTTRWLPASGKTIYSYDLVGNLTNVDYSTGTIATPAVRFTYDALNRLRTMADGVGTTTLSNTATGQLQSEGGLWTSDTISYAYYQGQLTNLSLAQPGASVWTQAYGYDPVWRLKTLSSPAGNFGYGYSTNNPASTLVQSITLPNFAAITNQYDSLARLTNTALQNVWGHVLDGYGYGMDYLGLRTNVTRNLGLTTNGIAACYDNIGQLTSWSATEANGTLRLNEQLGYGYDSAGNLNLRTNNALVQTFGVDTVNQLTTVTRTGTFTLSGATPAPAAGVSVNGLLAQTNGDFTFARANLALADGSNTFTIAATNAYGVKLTNVLSLNLPASVSFLSDSNGNLTSDGTRSFVYDAENRLTNVNVAGQWKTEFVYDGFGRKRRSFDYGWQGGAWVRTNETRFVYDGLQIIQERDGNNIPQVTYTRGLDLSGSVGGAGGIGGLLARTDANGSAFYHADGSGNVTSLIDASQNIVARYLYDPYGRLIGKWGPLADANRYRFSSMEYLPNAGLYGYTHRFYDPALQRWMNKDPIGELGGLNLYTFVENNPLLHIDPAGLDDDDGFPNLSGGTAGSMHNASRREAGGDSARILDNSIANAHADAAILRAGFEANPIVGFVNNGSQALLGKDAINPNQTLTTGERWKSAGWAAADVAPGMIKAGKLIKDVAEIGEAVKECKTIKRALTAADLGIKGKVINLKGTFTVHNGIARVYIDALEAKIQNPLEIMENLMKAAKAEGADALRITSDVAEVTGKLRKILEGRYGMFRSNGKDVIVIMLK